jgi:hypothetical protein
MDLDTGNNDAHSWRVDRLVLWMCLSDHMESALSCNVQHSIDAYPSKSDSSSFLTYRLKKNTRLPCGGGSNLCLGSNMHMQYDMWFLTYR